MGRKVFIVGVGMRKFEQPGKNKLLDYPEMAARVVRTALTDAQLPYEQVQHASIGYVYGDSSCGQAVLYELGMTQIPIVNVNNNCATGSSALMLAKQLIEGGLYDCTLGKMNADDNHSTHTGDWSEIVLENIFKKPIYFVVETKALGFEKMERGSLGQKFKDRVSPLQRHIDLYYEKYGLEQAPMTAQLFGQAGLEHNQRFGSRPEHFAEIALKNHRHARNNPNAQPQPEVNSVQDVLNAEVVGK